MKVDIGPELKIEPITDSIDDDQFVDLGLERNSNAASQRVSEWSDAQSFPAESELMNDDMYSEAESRPMTPGNTQTGGDVATPTASDV